MKALLLALAGLVLLSRVPLLPGQLFSFDDVNPAYAVGELDVRKSQPHPPGYPLFVLQMRALRLVRVVNPESALQILSLAGTIAAAAAMVFGLRGFAGLPAAAGAAALLVFHPANWYASLTSALRVQLALVSIAVAAACWRAWGGDRRWVWGSAVVLAAGSGIRPEAGLVLFPLWCAAVWRGTREWKHRLLALVILAAGALAWLLPLVAASGGLEEYARVSWHYLRDQAALTSGFFGASLPSWRRTAVWLLIWSCCGAAVWPLLWRRGPGLSRGQWLFLALWAAPAAVFALFVHIADPGQALAIVPAMCLFNGVLASRANFVPLPAPVLTAFLAAGAGVVALGPAAGIFLFASAAGIAAFRRFRSASAWTPAATALAPELALYFLIFGALPPLDPPAAVRDFTSAFHAMSLAQVRETVAVDDRLLREIASKVADESPVYVLWDRSELSWRKLAHYLPRTPVVVLDRASLTAEAPPVVTRWRGPQLEWRSAGENPVTVLLPAGSRIVWARPEGVIAENLPAEAGSRSYGPYRIEW
jgi:hypothetical protein